ncbi:hypothetical protein N7494_010072 [Penicillium frequentans]|uniref:Tuberin N-terminal domain-containing protein n=1 Tax=Penicillium frequentans TaxID=3151616 RepID=A0AAD6CRH4_9EURO|nr:hypothetical protein N7494_010072 [Penicillium glabrum]
MSSDDARPVPEHKPSSTSFADVFKTLAVGRPKSHSPVSIPESNSDSISQNRQVLGLEFMHRASVVSSSSDTPSAPDIDSSFRNLSQKQNLPHAIDEAESISKSISWFTPEQSVGLWEAAEYLLHHESPDAQKSGAKLLEAVAARQDLSPSARRLVFESIACPTEADVIASRVQSLISLSDHGRKLDFTTTSILHIISSWIVPLYGVIATARAKTKKGKSGHPNGLVHEEIVLGDLLQFAVDLVTLQRKPPTQEEVELLLTETFAVCRKTSVANDIKNALSVFDAVIVYADVPDKSFTPLLEVLCSIHASVKSLSGPTSRSVRSLAKSRRQSEMLNTLHGFMRETSGGDASRNLNVIRGTLYVFSDLVHAYGQGGMPQIPFDQLIDSLMIVAHKDDRRVDAEILDLCLNILEGDYTGIALRCDWTSFISLLVLCSRTVFQDAEDTIASPTSPQQTPAKGTHDDIKSSILADIIRIASVIESLWEQLNKDQRHQAVRFLAKSHQHIEPSQSELIINMMREDQFCRPSEGAVWVKRCRDLIERFIQPRKQSSDIRILALDTLKESLSGNEHLIFSEEHGLLDLLLQDFSAEHDLLFLESLVSFLTEPAMQISDDGVFKRLVDTISSPMKHDLIKDDPRHSTSYAPSSRRTSTTSVLELTLANVCAVGLVKMMLRALNHSATKSVIIYESLLQIAQSADRPTDSRLSVLKLLFRLRCDSAGSVSVVSTSEGDFLMNVLGRNIEVGSKTRGPGDSPLREPQTENVPPFPSSKLIGKDLPASVLSKSAPGRGSISSRSLKLTPPVWTYALPQVLPEQPPGESSPLVYAHTQADAEAQSPVTEVAPAQVGVLKVNMWLEVVILLLQRETDWDVYSYVLTHLGPQLGNKEFFKSSSPQIKLLRSILCDQVKNETFHEPPDLLV